MVRLNNIPILIGAVGFRVMLGGASLCFWTLSYSANVFIVFKRDLLPVYVIINLIIKAELNPESWLDLCETLNKGSRQVFVSFINISLWNNQTNRNPTKMSQLMDFLFATLYKVTEILVANCSLTDGIRRDGFLQPVLPSFGSLKFRAVNTFCRGRRVFGCFLGALLGEFQVF